MKRPLLLSGVGTLSCFDEAVMNLHKIGVLTVVHLILGLPGETDDMMT